MKHIKSAFGDVITPDMRERFLFTNPDTGRCYRQKVLNNVWREHSGLDIDHYSASRHSFCTQIVETGADALQAQRLLRHADLRSTQKHFHATPAKLRDIVNRRGQLVPLASIGTNRNGKISR